MKGGRSRSDRQGFRLRRTARALIASMFALAMVVGVVAAHSGSRTVAQSTSQVSSASNEVPLRIAFYGDSIAWEIADFVEFLFATERPIVFDHNAFGGTNACDWFGEAAADVGAFDPDVVITLFTGNALTPCMRIAGPLSLGEIAVKTASDSRLLVNMFPAAVTYHVTTPRTAAGQVRLDGGGISIVDEVSALLSSTTTPTALHLDLGPLLYDDGRFASKLPCAAFDPGCDGSQLVPVRAPDGVHLCPVGSAKEQPTEPCPVHSSGAIRLAIGLVEFVLATYPPPPINAIDQPADLGSIFGRPVRGASTPAG